MAERIGARRVTISQQPSRAVNLAKLILYDLFGPPARRNFIVRYWDGTIEPPIASIDARFTLVIKRAGALRRMLLPPSELAIGEAYLRDDFDIEGNLEACLELTNSITKRLQHPSALLALIRHVRALPGSDLTQQERRERPVARRMHGRLHSRERDASAVRAHYDIGNDFYRLWLDHRMIYTCAYFPHGTEDLDSAQSAKLDLICRKLRLKPGERLLDIGCGWGGLIMYAAQEYGVHAVGVTLSQAQADLASRRIRQAGLQDRCHVEYCDYRDYRPAQPFDKISSIEMFEQVGKTELPTYFTTLYRLIRPGGLFLNQGIVSTRYNQFSGMAGWLARCLWRNGVFLNRYVFPDGELEKLDRVVHLAEAAGFGIRDIESLPEHYVLTLRNWVQRLESKHAEIVQLVGETNYRIWRLYLSTSAWTFATGKNNLTQLLLTRRDDQGINRVPLTRNDIYR